MTVKKFMNMVLSGIMLTTAVTAVCDIKETLIK